MRGAVKTALTLFAAVASLPLAMAVQAGGLDDLKPVDDTVLAESRGGFFTAEGANFDFGANIQTLVNGELALQSTLQWTPGGVVAQTVTGNIAGSTPIPDAELKALSGTGANILANGLRITSTTGQTDVITNLSSGQIQNIIANSASGQAISQNTNITMTIYNFADWQQAVAQQLVGAALARDSLDSVVLR